MLRYGALIALCPLLLLATPASAVTKQEKMETCKVGAESDNLTGKKRDTFIKRCMAAGNYEPAARKDVMKKKPAAKKPAAAQPATQQ
jgi:psiF repeat